MGHAGELAWPLLIDDALLMDSTWLACSYASTAGGSARLRKVARPSPLLASVLQAASRLLCTARHNARGPSTAIYSVLSGIYRRELALRDSRAKGQPQKGQPENASPVHRRALTTAHRCGHDRCRPTDLESSGLRRRQREPRPALRGDVRVAAMRGHADRFLFLDGPAPASAVALAAIGVHVVIAEDNRVAPAARRAGLRDRLVRRRGRRRGAGVLLRVAEGDQLRC